MKVIIGSDHAGYEAKKKILSILSKNKYSFEDMGTNSTDPIDYPDVARKVCDRVSYEGGKQDPGNNVNPDTFGVLICGTGTGMQIAANKHNNIRAAFCYDAYGAKMARKDNDANVLTLRAREFDWSKYEEILLTFLTTSFSQKQRHSKRIEKLK